MAVSIEVLTVNLKQRGISQKPIMRLATDSDFELGKLRPAMVSVCDLLCLLFNFSMSIQKTSTRCKCYGVRLVLVHEQENSSDMPRFLRTAALHNRLNQILVAQKT
jgi:hypothetical protein